MLSFSQSEDIPALPLIASVAPDPAEFCSELLVIADSVCDDLLRYYADPATWSPVEKSDSSPVTAADHAAHDRLRDALGKLTPDIPLLSEESPAAEIDARLGWNACWMVDPLDGTREFIDRSDEFTCNLALVVDGRPVLGLISIPVTGHHYLGVVGAGAIRCAKGAGLSGVSLAPRPCPVDEPLVLMASARHSQSRVDAMMSAVAGVTGRVIRRNAGSAVKFCVLLDGGADVYPRSSPCYEWDVAAGDALVTAAGGRLCDYDGEFLRYNERSTLLAQRFVAMADASVDYISLLANSLPGLSPCSSQC